MSEMKETCSRGLDFDEVVCASHDLGLHLERLERLEGDASVLFHKLSDIMNHSPLHIADGFRFAYTASHLSGGGRGGGRTAGREGERRDEMMREMMGRRVEKKNFEPQNV